MCVISIGHNLLRFWQQTKDSKLLAETEDILQTSGAIWRLSFAENDSAQDKVDENTS
jgi:hypothetical protein